MLQLCDVALYRAGDAVLHGLNLTLAPGQGALVRGPNGSGKTTLLRTVCGWRRCFDGSITWRGQPLRAAIETLRKELAYLGHQDGLHEDLSPRENLSWLAGMGGEAPRSDQIDHALAEMGMLDLAAKPARLLSRGQRRRTALARFLFTRKPLWVLDEPLAALDAPGQQQIRACVIRHLHAGGLALLSCHTNSWPHHSSLQNLLLPARPLHRI
ncbi:MAG: heme ABC exporter ATP-binding protein CcmA [Leptothrix sp. (in: Bacteria)]|nr:heme ABC exporter ATP-binding protein CcmA [Leptothrix sp. (in: b-proteobacteria)]